MATPLGFKIIFIHEGELPAIVLDESQPIFSDSNLLRLKERLEHHMEHSGTRGIFKIPELTSQAIKTATERYNEHVAREAKLRLQAKKKKKKANKSPTVDSPVVLTSEAQQTLLDSSSVVETNAGQPVPTHKEVTNGCVEQNDTLHLLRAQVETLEEEIRVLREKMAKLQARD